MQILKNILIVILVISVLGTGFYYISNRLKTENLPKLPFNLEVLQKLQPLASSSFSTANSAVKKGQEFSQVLGVDDTLNEVSKNRKEGVPLYQQAFERTRYTYCQQVIVDYQERYPASTAPPQPSENH